MRSSGPFQWLWRSQRTEKAWEVFPSCVLAKIEDARKATADERDGKLGCDQDLKIGQAPYM